jgi:pimeloyl-ACP methyl ester carboxylesterase
MVDWKDSKLELDGKTIHYYYHIDGNKPTMFFLHGFMDNGLCYNRVAEQFLDRFNVILPDARGHGQTSDPPKGASFKEMLEDLIDLCNHLKLDKIYIQGHSMGGAQAALFSAEYPERVHAVILEDPAIISSKMSKIMMSIFGFFLIFVPHKKTPASIEKYIKRSKFMNKKWAEQDQLVWAQAQQEFETHYAYKNALMIKNVPNGKNVLPKITAPILLLTSESGIVKQSTVKELLVIKPEMTWEYIAGAGHNIRREQFEHEIDAIKKFLDKVH